MSKIVIPQLLVNSQPMNLGSMDPYHDYQMVPTDEKRAHICQQSQCNDGDECEASHKGCHGARLRRILLPLLVAFLTLCIILAFSCMGGGEIFGMGVEGLARRAAGDTTTDDDPFVHNKLYLIVILVGLFVVIILAIMLSAWCCKGVFQNPLCCPCYLCACCGGLACLECIGCGLCAEGLEQA
ncbi:hypothetical protein BDZ94DRAFT_1267254 [Collybia nuda]|uniref:Uncharacterized protein n=1 Tax=Collybia nuda TaxID=64659 RepID=A0A9P5XY95_9AGAR|nr:hypothetical protein BDZ94DRAFT_1267254 [Collybia nuda]